MSDDVRHLPAWKPVSEALGALRSYGTEVEEYVLLLLSELDDWRSTVRRKEEDVGSQRRGIAEAERDLGSKRERLDQLRRAAEASAHRVQHEARCLAQARDELESQRAAWEAERSPSGDQSGPRRDAATARWQTEREALLRELGDARRQVGKLAELAIESGALQQALAQARGEVLRLRHRLAARSRIEGDLADRVQSLEQRSSALEQELNSARERETALQAQAETAEARLQQERAAWLEELRRLRSAAEHQAELSHAWPSASPWIAAAPESDDAQEPTLQSVIAELEQIQKELSQTQATSLPTV